MMLRLFFIIIGIQWFTLSACAKSAHQTGQALLDQSLSAELRRQIDSSISFSELEPAPSNYVGRMVMLSGVVLHPRRATDHTEIEILQLSTGDRLIPSADRTKSEGRFLAFSQTLIDPATIEENVPVTVVGKVSGAETRPLDQIDYTYPVIDVTRLLTWTHPIDQNDFGFNPYGYYGGYYQPYPYWGGAYGYGWGPYYPFFFGAPPAAPAAPPPQSIPPQFRKHD